MILRPYQELALAGVQGVYRSGRKRALLVAPTGSGKSAMTRYMLSRTSKRTLILCHRAELLEMIAESLSVPHGIIGGSKRTPSEPVHIGMMQTVSRRLADLPVYDWVISDEAHLAMCATWRSILQHYSAAWHLGLSATPCRLDGKGLGAEFEQIVYGPSIRELTDRGYLAPCRVFAPVSTSLAKKLGELSLAGAAAELDHAAIIGDAIAEYRRLANGRQGIVFCSSTEHAEHVAAQFTAAGIPAVNVDGAMPTNERRQRIDDFRARRFLLLVNCELLTTGFDCPQIEVGIFLRRTESLALYLQMVGRILRIFPGKRDAILIDHVGNVLLHGMPEEEREWTLDGRAKRSGPVSISTCPKCYAAYRPAPRCPSCGHVALPSGPPRRAPKSQDGQLQEVTSEIVSEIRAADVKELVRLAFAKETDVERRLALEAIRKAMGYDRGWTFMQIQLRRRFALKRKRAA